MAVTSARAVLLAHESETKFQNWILRVAARNDWWTYHPYDSRRSRSGWPDLVLLRPPQALFVELKAQTGVVTTQQKRVLGLLQACGLDARIWRPSNEEEIIETLAQTRCSPSPHSSNSLKAAHQHVGERER